MNISLTLMNHGYKHKLHIIRPTQSQNSTQHIQKRLTFNALRLQKINNVVHQWLQNGRK